VCASALTEQLNFKINAKGHLNVLNDLSIENYPTIFAIGDVANFTDEQGKPLPPTAQLAERSAEHVVRNIALSQKGQPYKNFSFINQGLMIALGGEYGAGILPGGIKVKGYLAYLIKKAIFWMYTAPLRRRSSIGKRR
jgi:NADH dehydrogenase